MALTDKLTLAIVNTGLKLTNRRLVRRYRRFNKRDPEIAFPRRYSDRMVWRKIVDRNPLLVTFTDKLGGKDYVRRVCPDLPVPKTLWVGTDANLIPEEILQRDVFIKANHGCDFNHRTYGRPCDRTALAALTSGWLKKNYGHDGAGGQWTYDRVDRKIFVEETIGLKGPELIEFNVRASNGRAMLGSVMGKVKTPDQWYYYLDPQGRATWGMSDLPGDAIKPVPPELDIAKPYEQAVRFTERLSRGVDYARFDFMWDGEALFGGEITVFPAAGGDDPLHPHVIRTMDEGWDLNQSHFLQTPQSGWRKIYANALKRKLQQSSTA